MSLQTITLLGMCIGSSRPHSPMPPEYCTQRRVQNAGRSLTPQPVSTKLLLVALAFGVSIGVYGQHPLWVLIYLIVYSSRMKTTRPQVRPCRNFMSVHLSCVPVRLFRGDAHLLYPLSCKHHSPHSDSWRPRPSYKPPGR